MIKSKFRDFFCGLHSNIPQCCILFFIGADNFTNFIYSVEKVPVKINGVMSYCDYYKEPNTWKIKNTHYFPCPKCILKLVSGEITPNPLISCNCANKSFKKKME